MSLYYIMYGNEDGEVYIEAVDQDELKQQLADGEYGDPPRFLSAIPNGDMHDQEGSWVLIVKGELVVPSPRTVAVTYDV